jgi:hypothetical protein
MSTVFQLILAVAALIALAPDARGQSSMHVTPVEIAQLPRFCWAQLQVPDATGDDFRIRDCGPAANHFCSALIYMVRARGNVKKQARLDLLGRADIDVRYTENAIADYPKCSIRDDVAGARAQVNSLLTMYGSKRPRAQ